MPAGSFRLVFQGDSRCSDIFQAALQRDAAWQMAIEEGFRRNIILPESWARKRGNPLNHRDRIGDDLNNWYMYECFPQAMRDITAGTYIDGLLDEIRRLKNENARAKTVASPNRDGMTASSVSNSITTTTAPSHRARPSTPSSVRASSDIEEAVNAATLEVKPWFINANVFRMPILISEVADAAFTTRFRQVICDPSAPQPKHMLRLNYAPDRELMSLIKSEVVWPTPSRSRFLVEVALKYVGRRYHVVRRSSVMEDLEQSIHNPSWGDVMLRSKLWALFAIGELYSTRSIPSVKDFPGMAYFAKASRIMGLLDERPGTDSIEIMLLISFYSLALNRRYSAFVMSGTAMRMAIVMGLHLNIPESQLRDPGTREHRKRLFWTTYIFDRIWASKLGHPSAIQDSDIGVDLPSDPAPGSPSSDDFDDTAYHIASLRLAARVTRTVRSIYGQRNQGDASLSTRVQQALRDLRAWVEDLPSHLQISSPDTAPKPISLHLSFNQYLFSALTILGASSLLEGPESRGDREAFEESARFLSQLRDAGNYAAQEYCHHVDVMKADLEAFHAKRMGLGTDLSDTRSFMDESSRMQSQSTAFAGSLPIRPSHTTAGMALAEPSLEELLAQPMLDLQFLESSFYDDLQEFYWPDFSTENWTDLA
ncbi:putative transcriptional regulatory protein [Colletotrichum spinosum]|uniref:Putative transcriptional regulatory protein n=1 Tax=Colletotrichum spinosum TaxID=1347390 RepID=A0A4R8PMI1_9PEZI|nr:putative transcriptional regulatory protein [Colletotrichum spinosum]